MVEAMSFSPRSWFLVQVMVEDFYLEGARWRGRELCMGRGVLEVNPPSMFLNYRLVSY
jgi:hypothetical protein